MKIITRKEAMSRGLTRYFTGKPCKREHVCERNTIDRSCLACNCMKTNRWRSNNPEAFTIANRKNVKQWRKQNPEKRRQLSRNHYKNNSEKVRQRTKRYYINNPMMIKLNVILRRKRNKQATPSWVNPEAIYQIVSKCPKGYEIDHIVPICGITPEGYRVSGLNVPWNLQIIPMKQNREKANNMTQRCYEIACSLKK